MFNSCHGGAIFPGIIDPRTGKSIIDGKKVTGFTTKGEEEEGVLDTIKSWKRPTIESSAADAGATCMLCIPAAQNVTESDLDVSPPGPWDSFTQTDGTIVTGECQSSDISYDFKTDTGTRSKSGFCPRHR